MLIVSNRFRWVFCQLDTLRRCLPSSIRNALNELPTTLDNTYERVLQGIPKEKRQHAHRAFQCLIAAIRPLRIEELAEIFAIDLDQDETCNFTEGWRPDDSQEAVLSTFSTLVSVIEHRHEDDEHEHEDGEDGHGNDEDDHGEDEENHGDDEDSHGYGENDHEDDEEDRGDDEGNYGDVVDDHEDDQGVWEDVEDDSEDVKGDHGDDGEDDGDDGEDHRDEHDREDREDNCEDDEANHGDVVDDYEDDGDDWEDVEDDSEDVKDNHEDDGDEHGNGEDHHKDHKDDHKDDKDDNEHDQDDHEDDEDTYEDDEDDHEGEDDHRKRASRIVQFSHFSVEEFLTSERLRMSEIRSIRDYHVPLDFAHTVFARACLAVVLHLDESVHLETSPLVSYAARHWVEHAKYGDVASRVQSSTEELFNPKKRHLAAWTSMHDVARDWYGQSLGYYPTRPQLPSGAAAALFYAAFCGLREVADYLITAHAADVNSHYGDLGAPLHMASGRGHAAVVRLLLQHNADVDVRLPGYQDWTPLCFASYHGHAKVVRILLEHGADVDVQSLSDSTPLWFASEEGHIEVVRLLLEHGADVRIRGLYSHTPLQRATDVEIARLLLEHGAGRG